MEKLFKKLYNKSIDSFYKVMKNNLIKEKKMFIVTANPETFMRSKKDEELNKLLHDKDTILVPDGIGIVKAAKIIGMPVKERITGIDIANKLLDYANELNNSIYLLGAKEEVIVKLKEVLKNKYPNIKLLGATNGYIEDKDKVFKKIKKLKPDIVLVALGIPYQEKLIYKHINDFDKGIFVGVGGSFDVISGTKKRAPKIFIKLNLEWLYRIMKEPKRLKRFYDSNIKFLFNIKKEIKKDNVKKKSKFIDKIKNNIKDNYPIYIIMLISLILHILATNELGFNYTLDSDDASYIESGIKFLETGKITMHGVVSAQIMPGMTYLIALFAFIFGKGTMFMASLKIFWMIMGITSIFITYKSIRIFTKNKYLATIPCLFFLTMDYIWMDNTILTETPFILMFTLLIYNTFMIAKKPLNKYYINIIICYILAVFLRPNIGIFPLGLIIYLLIKKYDIKKLMKQLFIAGFILLMFLIPWTYRNYKVFDKFIPLTYGMGNPKLLGTYQGVGYPLDEELDYKKNVDDKMSKEMRYYLEKKDNSDYMTRYYLLEYDGMKADYRMKEWWNKDKKSMILSYFIIKPFLNVCNCFYWDEVLGIELKNIVIIRIIELILFAISFFVITLDKKSNKELLFLLIEYAVQVALYSYSFAFSRYAASMFFIRYIIIGIALGIIYDKIINRRCKNECTYDNTCL